MILITATFTVILFKYRKNQQNIMFLVGRRLENVNSDDDGDSRVRLSASVPDWTGIEVFVTPNHR